jgi:hypothetical protein
MFRIAVLCALLALGVAPAARAASCPGGITEAMAVRGSLLCVVVEDPTPARRQLLHTWIERSANIVADYYARFPVALVSLHIGERAGDGIGGGRTTNDDGLLIRVSVGRDVTPQGLEDDWVLVHEMIHLALPELGPEHNWLAEGLAVYVEGVARAQAGNRAVSDVWAEDRRRMPLGLPRAGEGGMDQTPTWARTYWGGALFCLQAEVGIRQATHNTVGLQTALRAILGETGGYAAERDIDRVLRIGDRATGTHVLTDLYERNKSSPEVMDLDSLWRELGVPEDPATQRFDDRAPLAAIRIAITAPPAKTAKN